MIIPWLRGFQNWKVAPLTWALILTNLFIFLMTYEASRSNQQFISQREIVLTGRLYDQYLAEDIKAKTNEELILLGSRALRDPVFIESAQDFKFSGDAVAIQQWKQELEKFRNDFQKKKSHLYGLLTEGKRPLTWITYQFMHAGWVHLLSNMFLLLLFGAAFESRVGSDQLIVTYLLSGLAGGFGFLWLGGHSLAPMVGASGSLSGVMAAYAVAETRKRVGFFYFLSPIEGYYGLIHLPTWFIFPLCFVADLASYLSTPAELGAGVAYAAHLGGVACGTGLGLFYRFVWRKKRDVAFEVAGVVE